MLATCATDRTVTLWDTHPQKNGEITAFLPHPCGNKDMHVGKLYSVAFYPSAPWLLGCGGSAGELALWDLSSESSLVQRFSNRLSNSGMTPVLTDIVVVGQEMDGLNTTRMADHNSKEVEVSASEKKGKAKKSNRKKVHRKGR